MDLIIIRHGATEDNSRGFVRNSAKATLSAQGKKQAESLAIKLKDEHIMAMYSSDFQRCIETAEVFHAYHQNVPLKFTSKIQEMRGGGTLDKMGLPPIVVVKGIQILKLLHTKTPGGESWEELCARVGNFLNAVFEEHSNDKIVLVTHGIAMQAMRSLLEDNRGRKFKLQEVPNCTVWEMKMKKSIKNLKK
jgi:broad specificity phosphatase PhoE